MKLNIFRIPPDQLAPLRKALGAAKLVQTNAVTLGKWAGEFYFSTEPKLSSVPWVKTFAEYIGDGIYSNRNYFGAMMLARGTSVYALSFGKAHFHIRPHCDYDFGVELAKRIADEDDITQTASRQYQGRRKRSIQSYIGPSKLTVAPGSSVDFLQGKIVAGKRAAFGSSGKFGTSCLLTPEITPQQIGTFLSQIDAELKKPARFKLPRTLELKEEAEIAKYDEKLIDELMSPVGVSDIAVDTFDLFGVDFVFSSVGSFTVRCGHYAKLEVDQLTMKTIKDYLTERAIPREKVLHLKIKHHREEQADFIQSIKEAVDFISDDDHVVLRGGKWLKFNQDYLEALDEAIRAIEVESTEAGLEATTSEEGDFNKDLKKRGYVVADKNFDILKVKSGTPVEAWDLQRGDTVYAVKFGTPQKLNYVVDQATNVLDLISTGGYVGMAPVFKRYCLWFGYRAKKPIGSVADSGSIIFKQKVEAWARRCHDAGKVPLLKITQKIYADSK
ncbi:DUF6119 family protein [Kribbella speibonae]|uniref:Sporadically distributed protein, TIGR04141 family n=1 Tax=Kribbella speibonae TaxID=1572660 RepID=A0A4R0IH29_9ACTN|nr:DUF6119 family protein [Kribbella speibonae]TCC32661.1 hypothetical protein E0H92_31220 [Kribbella speibonae]